MTEESENPSPAPDELKGGSIPDPPRSGITGSQPSMERYVPGAKDEYGNVIKAIIGRHHFMVVYLTEAGKVGWRYTDLPERLRPAVAEFQVLNGLARTSLEQKYLPQAMVLLAESLYAGLLSPLGSDPVAPFGQASAYIHKKATEKTRLYYALLTVLFGALFPCLTFVLYTHCATYEELCHGLFIGAAGGVLGALVSLMQRARNLAIEPLDSVLLLTLQGIIRLALGACFGLLFVVAVKADIAIGHFAHNGWALLGLATGAGFSERWVPELLGRQHD